MKNSSFRRAVLSVVATIPKGSVMSYKQVAIKAGYPKAYRAVASLMAKNYEAKIPCHRVIRSDGRLGDYNRGGEAVKQKLLQNEGAII